MLRNVVLLPLLAGLATPAFAQAVAAPGTEAWCTGMATTREGVFFFPDGREAMAFRIGIEGASGCYAWLNAVPDWGLEPGYGTGTVVLRDDRTVIVFPSGVEVHVTADGRAEHHRQGWVTQGEVR